MAIHKSSYVWPLPGGLNGGNLTSMSASVNEQSGFKVKIRPAWFRAVRILVALSATFFSQSCGNSDPSQYAVASVSLPDGQPLYFKREVRGITGNYDVIAISANGDPCVSQDDKTDYCICSSTEQVYYKLDAATLHLYGSTTNRTPAKFPLQLKVENHEINPMDQERFKRDYAKQGINRLDLVIKPENRCK